MLLPDCCFPPALQALLRHQARLAAASRLLEQQKVLDVLAGGPTSLGYDAGRPAAAIIVFRWETYG